MSFCTAHVFLIEAPRLAVVCSERKLS